MQQYYLLGNKVTSISINELNNEVKSIIIGNRKELILNTNVHGINLALKYPWLRDFRNSAYIVHCDGAGVMLGLKTLGYQVVSRITIHDWIWDLADICQQNSFSMYFLGAEPGIANRAAERIRAKYPNLRIEGVHHGYFAKDGVESEAIISSINAVKPDILIVGFGMPIQEEWMMQNWGKINAHVCLAGGGCFDVLSGNLPTCPRWMADHGLEWLLRLVTEPKRLFARYMLGNPLFASRVIREKLSRLVSRNVGREY